MLDDKRLKLMIDLKDIESKAIDQIENILKMDFIVKLAIMPDVHMGYTLPIGGVALTKDVISPVFVGYDIGCGMCLVETNIKASKWNQGKKERIYKAICEAIPVGKTSHEDSQDYVDFVSESKNKNLDKKVNSRLKIQLGTLGSGNHFIELGENKEGKICITIHSGSRNIGHSIATYYMNIKQDGLDKGFLHLDSVEGRQYAADLLFAQNYALDNRKHMMKAVLEILNVKDVDGAIKGMINENHNHAIVLDGGLVLHRKGATPADKGQLGVIPANMRDGVYVTKGLGNDEYLNSASHGCGRTMGRNDAKRNLDVDVFKKGMKGIVASVDKSSLDEAPMAYKDANFVIDAQKGIAVDVIDHIKTLIVVKGTSRPL